MASGLKTNEHYVSIQGEGPNVGEMTQFLRFSGCNLRCPGWPCDTQHAIVPALYKGDPRFDAETLYRDCQRYAETKGAWRICLTGGEPLIQPKDDLAALVHLLINGGFKIDLFTNGTQHLPIWTLTEQVTVVMDWKLAGSGEGSEEIDTRISNAAKLRTKDAIKFVVKHIPDFNQAVRVWSDLMRQQVNCQFYVGAVWGSEMNDQHLTEAMQAQSLPWKLNVQLHKHIWHPEKRGV